MLRIEINSYHRISSVLEVALRLEIRAIPNVLVSTKAANYRRRLFCLMAKQTSAEKSRFRGVGAQFQPIRGMLHGCWRGGG